MINDSETAYWVDGEGYTYEYEDALEYGAEPINRYIREDLVYEKKKVETVLTSTPLFDNIFTDPNGNVWVKLPMKVNTNEK